MSTHHSAAGRLGAHRSWANTVDRKSRTRAARRRSPGSIEYHLDRLPAKFDGATDDVRRAAAESAKKAYYADLALKSARARAARKKDGTNAAA